MPLALSHWLLAKDQMQNRRKTAFGSWLLAKNQRQKLKIKGNTNTKSLSGKPTPRAS
jgi:hypothetical protein